MLLPKDPNDEKDVILEVRGAAGGEEAALFAGELLRMYLRYAEKRGWKYDLLNSNETGIGGYKEAVVEIHGTRARTPPSSLSRASIASSASRRPRPAGGCRPARATVIVMPEAEDVEIEINEEKDIEKQYTLSQGAGGQNVQKNDDRRAAHP